MSKVVEGVVWKIYTKVFRGRENFTVKIDGDPLYYRLNTNRYPGVCEEGNRIKFTAEENSDGQSARVLDTPVIVTPPAGAAAAAPASAGAGGSSSGLQMRYQGALERAILFVDVALKNGAIVLPAAKAKKLGVLEAALDKYTAQFYDDTNTLGAVTREAENFGTAEESDDDSEGEDE